MSGECGPGARCSCCCCGSRPRRLLALLRLGHRRCCPVAVAVAAAAVPLLLLLFALEGYVPVLHKLEARSGALVLLQPLRGRRHELRGAGGASARGRGESVTKARSRTWEVVTPSRAPQRGGERSFFSGPCEAVAASFVRRAAASGARGKGISQEAVSSVSGVQGGGSVAYVSRPLSALPIATLYKGSASIHCSLGMLLGP